MSMCVVIGEDGVLGVRTSPVAGLPRLFFAAGVYAGPSASTHRSVEGHYDGKPPSIGVAYRAALRERCEVSELHND